MTMGKSRKHTAKHAERGDHYRAVAAGYQILKSPLADSYHAAVEHYQESDPVPDFDGSDSRPAQKLEQEKGRH
jgi:hypothetical protein